MIEISIKKNSSLLDQMEWVWEAPTTPKSSLAPLLTSLRKHGERMLETTPGSFLSALRAFEEQHGHRFSLKVWGEGGAMDISLTFLLA